MRWVEIRYIWINSLFFASTAVEKKVFGRQTFLELQTMSKDGRLRVSSSAEGLSPWKL